MPKLPIEKLNVDDFNNFKKKHLDGVLTKEGLDKIAKLFLVGDSSTGHTDCDEAHQHHYSCVYFKNAMTGIVDRLLQEIRTYRDR